MAMKTNAPRLAHLVLRVRDLSRSERFYTQVLGLQVTGQIPGIATSLSSDKSSHTIELMNADPDPSRMGLSQFAFQVDSPQELREFYDHLVECKVHIVGTGDHGISQGIYFRDPDGNEIEVFHELPRAHTPSPDHSFDNIVVAKPFNTG
jgi:catechol 2,3-dioxygenase